MMTKYYRVRTQEQWYWLMKRIESDNRKARFYSPLAPPCRPTKLEMHPEVFKKDVLAGVNGNKVEWDTFNYFVKEENVTEFIEVSDLMEGEKMENEDYVTLKDEDLEKVHWETNYGHTSFINHDENGEKYAHEQYLPANLIIPKSLVQQKVKMTQTEKDEFDALKRRALTLIACFGMINEFGYPHLDERLHGNNEIRQNGLAQNEFARAWADPSLIEVVKEPKYNVKVPNTKDCLYYKINNSVRAGVPQRHPSRFKFTASELKEYGLDDDMYEKVEVKE